MTKEPTNKTKKVNKSTKSKNSVKENKKEVNKETNVEKRKPNKLIIVLVIILIIVIIISVIVRINNKDKKIEVVEEDKQEDLIVNTKENVVKSQEVEGIAFSDIALISQNDSTYMTIEMTNKNNNEYKIEEVHIILKDKDGNYMINYLDENNNIVNYLVGYVGDTLKPGENRTLVTAIDNDISKETYTVEYEIIK